MDSAFLLALIATCAPQVDTGTALALIAVESATNPYAIGVVGGILDRHPQHRAEAIATAQALKTHGWNFSVGIAQINVHNFDRLGLSIEDAFDPCANLTAMQTILIECFDRAASQHASQPALRHALSCYYSGNFVTGFEHGYVRRVAKAAARQPRISTTPMEAP